IRHHADGIPSIGYPRDRLMVAARREGRDTRASTAEYLECNCGTRAPEDCLRASFIDFSGPKRVAVGGLCFLCPQNILSEARCEGYEGGLQDRSAPSSTD